MPIGQSIDFLNIDVEAVTWYLQSNDGTRFRPKAILVETLGQSIDEAVSSSATHFLVRVIRFTPKQLNILLHRFQIY
jgi:hypothetical protein